MGKHFTVKGLFLILYLHICLLGCHVSVFLTMGCTNRVGKLYWILISVMNFEFQNFREEVFGILINFDTSENFH